MESQVVPGRERADDDYVHCRGVILGTGTGRRRARGFCI
jgi:hypothetical protein